MLLTVNILRTLACKVAQVIDRSVEDMVIRELAKLVVYLIVEILTNLIDLRGRPQRDLGLC